MTGDIDMAWAWEQVTVCRRQSLKMLYSDKAHQRFIFQGPDLQKILR